MRRDVTDLERNLLILISLQFYYYYCSPITLEINLEECSEIRLSYPFYIGGMLKKNDNCTIL